MSEIRRRFEKKSAEAWDDESDYVPVGVDGLVAASARLLAVNRGYAEPDERDNLAFKQVLTVPDLVRERIRIDEGKKRRKLFSIATRNKNFANFTVNALGGPIRGQFVGNSLSADSEQTNPMLGIEQLRRVTQMGPGGIGSTNAITEDMVSLDASTFGFFSSVEGPECHSADTEVFTKQGWIPWPQATLETEFACLDGKEMIFCKPHRLVAEPYKGYMFGAMTAEVNFLVTPNHRMWGCKLGEFGKDLRFTNAEDTYTQNLVCIDRYGLLRLLKQDAWVKKTYNGMVYCATVPGGLLCTRRSLSAGIWSGNSELIGIDSRLASGTRIGSDGRLYQRLRNRRTGKLEYVSPADLLAKVVKIPD